MERLPIIPHTWKKWDYSTGVAECEWVCVSAVTCRFKGSKQQHKTARQKNCLIDFPPQNGCICGAVAAGSQCKAGRVQRNFCVSCTRLESTAAFYSSVRASLRIADAFCFVTWQQISSAPWLLMDCFWGSVPNATASVNVVKTTSELP